MNYSESFASVFATFVVSLLVAIMMGLVASLLTMIGVPAAVCYIGFFIGWLWCYVAENSVFKFLGTIHVTVKVYTLNSIHAVGNFFKGIFKRKAEAA